MARRHTPLGRGPEIRERENEAKDRKRRRKKKSFRACLFPAIEFIRILELSISVSG